MRLACSNFASHVGNVFQSGIESYSEPPQVVLTMCKQEDVVREDATLQTFGLHDVDPSTHEDGKDHHAERATLGNAAVEGSGVAQAPNESVVDD